MTDLTRDDILRLAHLARIELTDEDVTEFLGEFSAILQYVQLLDNVDTTGLLPTSQVTGLVDVTRPDTVITYGYQPQDMLANVPTVTNGQIKVNRMVG